MRQHRGFHQLPPRSTLQLVIFVPANLADALLPTPLWTHFWLSTECYIKTLGENHSKCLFLGPSPELLNQNPSLGLEPRKLHMLITSLPCVSDRTEVWGPPACKPEPEPCVVYKARTIWACLPLASPPPARLKQASQLAASEFALFRLPCLPFFHQVHRANSCSSSKGLLTHPFLSVPLLHVRLTCSLLPFHSYWYLPLLQHSLH